MPSRRRLTAYIATGTALALTGGAVLLVVGLTQSNLGRDYVRRTLLDAVAPRVRGRLYVGRIGGNVFSGVTVDSVELRGPNDSLFATVGRLRVHYRARDLWDKRVLLGRVEIDRPVVHLVQDERGDWNYRHLFRSGPKGAPREGPGFGDHIVADSVVVRDGQFILTMPWHPADSLRGAARDSAVRAALAERARGGREIRRAGRYFTRTYRWTRLGVVAPYVRLAHPDSAGRRFAIARLDADENDPPFRWRNLRGDVRQQGDTVWAAFSRWDLPGSTGRGQAKIVWGSNLPVRYAVHVDGDSVSLADVAWVYPTLPRTGGGRMALDIRNARDNLRVLEYALSRMDVRTTRSRLTGAMTFAVGGPVLAVQDVALRAQPVDFDLLRTLAGGPFPYDFQGTLTGTVHGPGGPLNRFRVDSADVTFADRHVPGAVSRVRGRGGLDVLRPAETKFRGFAVDAERVDLRTIQYLNRDFPRLGGIVRGRAVLDSSYLDVRARDALFTHVDGPAAPTTVAGGGRVTFGAKITTYDLLLDARPLSFTTLARTYPALPARGTFTGPIRLQGATDDLLVDARLAGAAGTLAFDGRVNARGPVYAARGAYTVAGVSPRALTANTALPTGALNVTGAVDLRLSGLSDATGSVSADLTRSTLAGGRLDAGTLRVRAEDGRLAVDTLVLDGAAGRLRAAGALGLAADRSDTLRLEVRVDSLGGLRAWIAARAAALAAAADTAPAPGADPVARVVAGTVRQPVTQTLARSLARAAADTGATPEVGAAAPAAPPDSLAGELRIGVTLAGSVDTSRASTGLAASGTVRGRGLVYGRLGAEALDVAATIADVLRAPDAAVTLGADSLVLGGVAFSRAAGTFGGTGADGRFALRAGTTAGAQFAGGGRTARDAASTAVLLDSLRVVPRAGRDWTLAGPARLTASTADNTLALDSLVLRGADGSRLAVGGMLTDRGPVAGSLTAQRVSLADLGAVLGATGLAPALAPAAPDAGRPGAPNATPNAAPNAAPNGAAADSAGPRLDGLLSAVVALAGTRAQPTLDATVDATAVRVAGARVDRVTGSARYARQRLAGDFGVLQGGVRVLDLRGTLPVDLALVPWPTGWAPTRCARRSAPTRSTRRCSRPPRPACATRVAASPPRSTSPAPGAGRGSTVGSRSPAAACASTRPASGWPTRWPTSRSPATAWRCGASSPGAAARPTRWP
jgi:translocation and assembly module TamB